jgi:hypothetical protein
LITDPENPVPAEGCVVCDGCDPETADLTPVLDAHRCYYVKDTTDSGTIYWLQKKNDLSPPIEWHMAEIPHTSSTLEVTGVDVGDLLGGENAIRARQVRVEFNLLQHMGDDLKAFPMEVVPGTHGKNEVHGTSAFQTLNNLGAVDGDVDVDLLDLVPSVDVLRGTTPATGERLLSEVPEGVPIDLDALVFTQCGMLAIYQLDDDGNALPPAVLDPINLPTEVTVSGRITYGYVWNVDGLTSGRYRLKFYIDEGDCNAAITSGTQYVNEGANPMTLFCADGCDAEDVIDGVYNGGAYIDITLDRS